MRAPPNLNRTDPRREPESKAGPAVLGRVVR